MSRAPESTAAVSPSPKAKPVQLAEGRFARLEAIEWWDQALLARTRVLVIGAGALGNEVIKNLALLGLGHVVIADMDRIELSNLSRSALFRETDEGKFKSECAARAAKQIFGGMDVRPIVGNILADLGLGWFRWADVVIGALDNREARVFVNSACARVGRPWIDGGIEVLHGVARGFAPPKTACYECTMSTVDWDLLNKRRSCSLLARRAIAQRGTPTTPTTASVIGAIQVQEMIKLLHGRSALLGRGFVFDGAEHTSFTVNYPINPDCPWHEPPAPIEALAVDSNTQLRVLWDQAKRRLGGVDALDLAREIVQRVECSACKKSEEIFQPAEKIREDQLRCRACGAETAPAFLHSISESSGLLDKTAGELGLPKWDVIWARRGAEAIGIELSGDSPFAKK
ncbi:MAG TPA: ThiF family adenylyltransferase [Candidatus Polarisedimenticolia bacterium]|nr:ThiF family adenylyltransferase [Candidatus Polarisedimenticolia bacterium]